MDHAVPSITVASKTEKGKRPANEDAFLVLTAEELGGEFEGFFIVADGMGGRASGAVASSMAVNVVRDTFLSGMEDRVGDPAALLMAGFRAANDAVYLEAGKRPELEGMGTTLVAAVIADGRAIVGHLGDSRAYLLRDGRLHRLTEDHSFVAEKVRTGEITEEQARRSRFRNVITQAVGLGPDAEPEITSVGIERGDMLLLCTDGLSVPVPDAQIADTLATSSDVSEACDRLVSQALKNGGSDNVTAVLVAYGVVAERAGRPSTAAATSSKRRFAWVLPALIGLVAGIAIGLYPGRMILSRVEKPPPRKQIVLPRRPDLAHLEYEDPASLLYTPVQGKILALDPGGYLSVVDLRGQMMRVRTSGEVAYTFPPRSAFVPTDDTRSRMAATDSQGNLYISDPNGKRILKFSSDGVFIMSIAEGKLSAPEALAVDKGGSLYVIDAGRLKAIRPKPPAEQPKPTP